MRLIDADALLNEFTDERELWHWTGIRACIQAAPTVFPETQIEPCSENENNRHNSQS